MDVQIRSLGRSSLRLKFRPGIIGPQGIPGETSPQTLEARDFVADKADQVGNDAQAVEEARQQVVTSTAATTAARDQAVTAATQASELVTTANTTVANIVALYKTLALANAALPSHAEGAGINVFDDPPNNGLYIKEGGVWALQPGVPTLPGLAPIASSIDAAYSQNDVPKPYIWHVKGPDGRERELASVSDDGSLHWPTIISDLLSAKEVSSGGQSFYGYETLEEGEIILTDNNGRIIGKLTQGASQAALDALVTEMASARGTQANLAARLAISLDAKGNPVEPSWGSTGSGRPVGSSGTLRRAASTPAWPSRASLPGWLLVTATPTPPTGSSRWPVPCANASGMRVAGTSTCATLTTAPARWWGITRR
jgi:hypothetical protein